LKAVIAKLWGMAITAIPGTAWAMIEAVINTYRLRKERRATAMLPSEVRDELMAISTAAGKLLMRLFELEAAQPVDMMLSFRNELQALRSVELSLKLLADDVVEPGTDQDDCRLISTLVGIAFEFTGKAITRSGKSADILRAHIKLLCNAADPGIDDGTIDKAMQDCIKRHRVDEGPEDQPVH
jgi:hypothetical protein